MTGSRQRQQLPGESIAATDEPLSSGSYHTLNEK